MFDWDKIVVEVDNNVVDLTAGEVALLIAADADTVTWGNITGDMAQQADLMLELDSKIDVDSPEFTGTPRTPTPPAGNSSTRIANTKFVNDAINAVVPNGGFGDLAGKDKVDFYTDIINKPQNMPSNFGTLASKSYVDYRTDVTYKPTLGALASKDTVNYDTEVTNKPTIPVLPANTPASFGTLASKDSVNYTTEVTNKPNLGSLASKDSVDYTTEVTNKPTLGTLASKNSVDYETEVYNKPSSVVGQDDIAQIHLTPQNSLRVNAGDFRWYQNNLYMANRYYNGRWMDAPSGTFTIKYLADEVSAKFNKESTARVLSSDDGIVNPGEYFIFGNTLYRAIELNNQGQTPTQASIVVKLADEVEELYKGYAPYFSVYGNYGVGSYVKYLNTLYKFIYKHNTGDWDSSYVVDTNYSKELSTSELKIEAEPIIPIGAPEYEGLDKELRKAGAHAITKINVNYSEGRTSNVETIVFSGHKRITVVAKNGNAAMFNGEYSDGGKIQNVFYSIIVEDGAILELDGDIRVYHKDSNGILIRRGGMVIHHGTLNINLPHNNPHFGIVVESGGKFISDGTITATRGLFYESLPCSVIDIDYGGEAHVNSITSTNFNYSINCKGGFASYNSISGAGVTTSAGGRIYTGAQS